MTIESAKAYLERLRNDEDFRKEVSELSSPEDRTKFVKDNGFDFSKEHIEQVKLELSDDELDMEGGGLIPFDWCDNGTTFN
ncbi:MAG: Nif11-like leader peptide family natural product precursor [Gammaproteobacteria bacterium]|nr:Nif11-like leader peptide family natural product precursor [Gammaproteobacteria bacterium]